MKNAFISDFFPGLCGLLRWRSHGYNPAIDPDAEGRSACCKSYLTKVALPAKVIADSEKFSLFVTLVIIAAGFIVGLQTDRTYGVSVVLFWLDWIILMIFTFESLVKSLAEGTKPWRYFTNAEWKWNNFDFLIVFFCFNFNIMAGCYSLVAICDPNRSVGSNIVMRE